MAHTTNSSSSAFASFRSRVSKSFKQFACFLALTLVPPEAGEANCGAEFQDLAFCCASDREGTLEIGFRFHCIRLGRHQ